MHEAQLGFFDPAPAGLPVVPICRKATALILPPNHRHLDAHPVPHEGRIAIVTDVGLRDAVDALALEDEQRLRRTAKSCGPDASTLASSLAEGSAWRR
jgi:hypothetical protein